MQLLQCKGRGVIYSNAHTHNCSITMNSQNLGGSIKPPEPFLATPLYSHLHVAMIQFAVYRSNNLNVIEHAPYKRGVAQSFHGDNFSEKSGGVSPFV